MFHKEPVESKKQAINFPAISVESIKENLAFIKNQYLSTYKKIAELKNSPEQINFKHVVQPFIDLDFTIDSATTICTFPKQVHIDKDVRDASVEATKEIENCKIDASQDKSIFEVLRIYEENAYKKEKMHLSQEQNRYFESLMRSYKRNGMYISYKGNRDQIIQMQKTIADLCVQFDQNIAEDKTELNESELLKGLSVESLKGLPKDWFSEEKTKDLPAGRVRVTLQYPDVFPILDFAKNREIRKKTYEAFQSRCQDSNMPLLKKILLLRQKLANLLGYNSHADYAAEIRMAKNAKTVASFLKEMNERFDPLLDKNLSDLTAFARKFENNPKLTLQHYDLRYYMRLREEQVCNIDMEKIREYFPLEQVVSGTLKIYENLLGLKFVKRKSDNVWHPDCMVFDVYNYDAATKTLKDGMGSFYLDLHPREGKYTHACALLLSYGSRQSGKKQPSVAAMLCNFPKDRNIPFDDVVTFFHEFGHVMHFICSDAELINFHSDKTELDFIEAPSQMLENWCVVPDAIKLLSCHPKTKEPLPKEIADKLKLQDQLHAGYIKKRQLVFGHFDFLIHSMSQAELEKCDLNQVFHEVQKKIMKLPPVNDCFPASFGHLVGGYDAGYYGYLMSETYSADMFASVFKKDPLSAKAGAKYRQEILAPGAKYDAIDLLKNFLGRAPTVDAFLKKCGLEAKPQPIKAVAAGQGLFSNKSNLNEDLDKPVKMDLSP